MSFSSSRSSNSNMLLSSSEEVLQEHTVNLAVGLSHADIAKYRKVHGYNKLEGEKKDHILYRYIDQFKDPLILLLLGSAGLSIIVGQYEDAMSIAAAVIIVGSVAFYQEYRSEEALDALGTLVPPRCNAIRSGQQINILAEELVPGDIVKLTSGDRVPADIRILECNNLCIDESCLTGEVDPSEKTDKSLVGSNINSDSMVSEKKNIAFMCTLVCSGHAVGIVIGTALKTEFGKAFQEMKEIESRRTPLQVKMDELGKNLSIFSFAIIAIIGVIGMVQGKSFLMMFNIGVSLAVAAIPEGLPICVTVTLALGVMRMAQKKSIIKKLPAVEALGCADIICTDKTGTLTMNKMVLSRVFCPSMDDVIVVNNSNSESSPSGIGSSSSTSPLLHDQISGNISVNEPYDHLDILMNTTPFYLSYHGQPVDCLKFHNLRKLFDTSCMCNNAHVSGDSYVVGQPTEAALLLTASKLQIPDRRTVAGVKRVNEDNFTSETKFMQVRYMEHNKEVSYIKGAYEMILDKCSYYMNQAGDIIALSPLIVESIGQYALEMGRDGLRVIAVAYTTDMASLNKGKTNEYVILGIVGLIDPLRNSVKDAVRRIQKSGAKVMMITGDAEVTALSIAAQAGIYEQGMKAISGKEIEELVSSSNDDALASIIDDVCICYRTSPRHKLYIVRALQSRGRVVAMTGDGVNDAPALKAADIGIAMGSGTDVAKEAAAMIIVDDDFSTIVDAIEEGKSIFYNIKNFLTFQLSTSVAALSLVAINNLLGRPNPLNPMQILWINIIMDGPLAQSLGVEIVDPSVMQRPPRKRQDDIITRPLLMRVLSSGLLILIGTFYVFIHEMEDGEISTRDLTMTFTTFVMFDMFNAIACRHNSKPSLDLSWNSNKAFLLAISFSLIGQMMVIYFPPLQQVFRTEALSFIDIFFVVALASSMLVLDTLRKKYLPAYFTELLPNEYAALDYARDYAVKKDKDDGVDAEALV